MTSAPTRHSAGAGDPYAEGRGHGLVIFASVLLAVVGFFNLIYGISAIAKSHVFVANAHYVFGSLRTWGWITLILGVLLLLAAGGVLSGNPWARWFGVVVVGLNAFDQMFFIAAYPFWSLMIIAVDVIALYALCVYGSRERYARLSRAAPRQAPGVGPGRLLGSGRRWGARRVVHPLRAGRGGPGTWWTQPGDSLKRHRQIRQRRHTLMADLIAIGYPDETTAELAAAGSTQPRPRPDHRTRRHRRHRPRQRRQVSRPHQPPPRRHRRHLGHVLGPAVRRAVLRPVLRPGHRRRPRRPHGQGHQIRHRQRVPGPGPRPAQARHLGPVPHGREGHPGQGRRSPQQVRRHRAEDLPVQGRGKGTARIPARPPPQPSNGDLASGAGHLGRAICASPWKRATAPDSGAVARFRPGFGCDGVQIRGSGAEQLRLRGGELVVAQHTLLVQRGELVQLVEHRRLGWRWGAQALRAPVAAALLLLLLLEVADARVLLGLVLLLLCRFIRDMLTRDICATADYGGTHERTSSEHGRLPSVCRAGQTLRPAGTTRGRA